MCRSHITATEVMTIPGGFCASGFGEMSNFRKTLGLPYSLKEETVEELRTDCMPTTSASSRFSTLKPSDLREKEFLRSLEVLNVAGMLKPHLKNLNLSCCPVCVFLRPHYASVASFLRYAKGCLPRLPTSQPLRRTKDAINNTHGVSAELISVHPILSCGTMGAVAGNIVAALKGQHN
uniref:Uncharacterized protein n=1 Tax=Ascaris lumbricoides TaxID=6252 RepID=A0A0M3I5Q0_ASCLU